MVESQSVDFATEVTEGVDVGITLPAPVREFDTQLVSRAGGAHEVRLVDTKALIEIAQMGQGGFADTHRADLF